MYERNRKDIFTTKTTLISNILIGGLIILFSTFAGSLILQKQQHEQLNVFALQFPKSQQADLMAINSGKSPSTDNFNLPPGYKMQPILWNLSLPTTVTFNDQGNMMYIAEGGFIYGGLESTPRILQLNLENDNLSVLVDRNLNSPITDLKYHNGKIYVSNRDKISTVDPKTGFVNDIISGLPSAGDHHNNQIAFGYDGRLYFGQGTATNSGIVGGTGSESGGWLKSNPRFHDIPCKDIVLTGQNFNVSDPISSNPKENITTGAFVPLGEKTTKGQVVKGNIKCNGSILSSKLDGTDLKVVGWGLRNPYGLAFTGDRKNLLVTDNGANEKEPKSRPIASDDNKLYLINISNANNWGKFYGWPDFFGKGKFLKPVTDPQFKSPRSNQPLQFLIQNHSPVEKLFADPGFAIGISQTDIPSQNYNNNAKIIDRKEIMEKKGFNNNEAYIAEFGTQAPITHTPIGIVKEEIEGKAIIGQKVIKLDLKSGNYSNFISIKSPDQSFRPVGIKFNPNGKVMYIASIGDYSVIKIAPNGALLPMPTQWPYLHSGIIWKVTYQPP